MAANRVSMQLVCNALVQHSTSCLNSKYISMQMKIFEIKHLHNESSHFFLARSLIVIIRLEEINFGNSTIFVKFSSITISKDTSTSISSLHYVLYAWISSSIVLNNGVFMLSNRACFWNTLSKARRSQVCSQPLRTMAIRFETFSHAT
jgi:hypothetical protein